MRTAASAAGINTKDLAGEQDRLSTALKNASSALAAHKAALEESAAESEKKIAAEREAAAEEDRLARIVEASKARQRLAAQELLEYEKKAYAEAQAASKAAAAQKQREAAEIEAFAARRRNALSDAFAATGIRSSAQIQAEILKIQQGFVTLGASAKVSGEDFDRAFAEGQKRIAALRAEMAGVTDPLTESVGRSKSAIGSLVSSVKPIAASIAAAFGIQEVARMAADFDSLNRSMRAITGSGSKAAAEIGYITEASQRLGLDLQSTAKTYTSWLASVKGTALEGERGRAVFEAVSGSMSKLGKSSADTESAMLALGQMVSKGTISMEELRGQLAERLPGAMKAAADGAGVTVQQLTKMVETGSVLAEDLLPGMAEQLTKLYGTGQQAEGFVAGWNSLKSAAEETVGRIAQSDVVVKAVGLTFGAVKEVLLVMGTGLLTVAEGFGLIAKTAGTAAAAMNTGEWSKAKDEIVSMANESAARISELASKTATAGAVQQAFGSAVKQGGDAAAAASPKYLLITSAYTEVATAATKFTAQQEKAAAAREAEGKAALELAAAFGTEAQQREVSAKAAQKNAESLAKVAAARDAEAKVATSQLAAVQAEADAQVSAGQKLTDAKQDEINKIRESAKLKDEESAKAAAAAESARVHAEATRVSAQAYGDQSKQVYALRDAWQAAETEYQRLTVLNANGADVSKELRKADEERTKALALYRDALADATAAAERHVQAEHRAAGLQQSALQNDLYRANTILEIARQRGNEKDIAEAQIAVWRIELQINEAQAEAARKEAEAMALVAKAKRAELEASGSLTEAKKAELAVMDASVKAKQLEAEKYDLVADRMKALSYETKELKSTFGELSDAANDAATAADKVAGSYQVAASAIQSAASARNAFATSGSGDVISMAVPTPQGVTDRLKGLGVSESAAKAAAPQFFDAYGNVQNTYGRTLDDAVQALADKLTGRIPQASTMNVIRLDLRTNTRSVSAQVVGQSSAEAVVSVLSELASRS
ncbi:hypothetical protein GCM10007933_35030 [Zoogloea oryzae]|uniref:Tape measure protein N-terminal domain-containing protein n=1 Tax=Zoogloea oryzae TaxID=310767 RepID=A0ABQ6FFK8_9RHOO|nr:hypothetical protein GCM10007933_35030 [Zoogloea oryzae]